MSNKLEESDNPQIYCDMDGVLADFIGGAEKILGRPFNKTPKDIRWKVLREKEVFSVLKPMPDAKLLWTYIKQHDPFFLTAVPNRFFDQACEEKKEWMKKHFNISPDKVYCVSREDKQKFAKDGRDGRPNILIDDHIKNIAEWKKAGGLPVHHISAKNSISQLRKLGI